MFTVGVSAVTRDPAGRVLLVRTRKAGWELPGGRVQAGETRGGRPRAGGGGGKRVRHRPNRTAHRRPSHGAAAAAGPRVSRDLTNASTTSAQLRGRRAGGAL